MKTLLTFLLTFLFINTFGQSVNTEKLKTAFTNLKNDRSLVNQRKYFELFPNSFGEFQETFGYENGKAAPLYDGHEYIPEFFDLDSIPIEKQLEKCINISIGGHWEADAVNYFHYHLRSEVLKNVDLTYRLLKGKPNDKIESFFYFFFNEIHPSSKAIPGEFNEIQSKDKAFYELLVKGHERAMKHSGH